MSDTELLAQLPLAAREAFARAIALRDSPSGNSLVEAGKALAAAGMPPIAAGDIVYPLASAFEGVQRAALEYSAIHDLAVLQYPCPSAGITRRRWLGIDPPGVLETRAVEIEHAGRTTTEPLWRALQIFGRDVTKQGALLDALPCNLALQAIDELMTAGFGYRINSGWLFPHANLRLFRDLKDEARAWAIERAESLAQRPSRGAASGLLPFVFIALARAKVPIEPRWEFLFPHVFGAKKEFLIECARAIAPERRDAVVAPGLRSTAWAFDLVDAFPSAAMARGMLDGAEVNSDGWKYRVEQLRALGKKHPIVGETVEAIVAATPKPIELYVTRALKPKSATDLTELEREQLRIGGRGYDEKDLDAEARLTSDDGSETSFLGAIELRTLAGLDGVALYDAFHYLVDAGVIFRAGTTEEIGWLSQGGVVLKDRNDALRVAIQTALGPKAVKWKKPAKPRKKPKR